MIGRLTGPGDGHQLELAPTEDGDPGLARWARCGSVKGESMLFVADDGTPDVTTLVAALADNGVDVAADADEGRLVVVDPDRFYGGGYPQLIEHASDGGRRSVRTFGGPRVAAKVLTPEQFDDFETRLAAFWRCHGTTAVCRYDDGDLAGAGGMEYAFARHPSGWGEAYLHGHRPRPGLLVLAGEADMSNAHVLGAMMAAALRDSGPLLVVDCAALRFAAVGAWRAVADAVGARPGGRVRLTGTSPLTRRLLALLDLHPAIDVADDR
jgi:hypothetical protein